MPRKVGCVHWLAFDHYECRDLFDGGVLLCCAPQRWVRALQGVHCAGSAATKVLHRRFITSLSPCHHRLSTLALVLRCVLVPRPQGGKFQAPYNVLRYLKAPKKLEGFNGILRRLKMVPLPQGGKPCTTVTNFEVSAVLKPSYSLSRSPHLPSPPSLSLFFSLPLLLLSISPLPPLSPCPSPPLVPAPSERLSCSPTWRARLSPAPR